MWDSITPPEFRKYLRRMKWTVLNFQAFQRRSILAVDDSVADGKVKAILRRKSQEPESWREGEQEMLNRLLRTHKYGGKIFVMNDEAHHCYKPSENATVDREQKPEYESAALWFTALKALHDAGRLERVFDFSATPMWLARPQELASEVFPWAVSDFPLLDAIESGLVKIPRVPVEDDANSYAPKYRNIYEYNDGDDLYENLDSHVREPLRQLFAHYKEINLDYAECGIMPVFIIVANKISNAMAFYKWIAGTWDGKKKAGIEGNLDLFSNIDSDGTPKANPPTLMVHSRLFDPDGLKSSDASQMRESMQLFVSGKKASKQEQEQRIREIFMSVGQKGMPGERIRCVISVGMLTEGWDARNVTHIFGYRKFGSILLCEQVTGRALRRTSFSRYDEAPQPEYANVFGVPYMFARGGNTPLTVPVQPWEVRSLPDRSRFRINLPCVERYLPSRIIRRFKLSTRKVESYVVPEHDPSVTICEGSHGNYAITVLEIRMHTVLWDVASVVSRILDPQGAQKRTTFADALEAVRQWMEHPRVKYSDPVDLMFDKRVPNKVADACAVSPSIERPRTPVFADEADASGTRLASTKIEPFWTTLPHRYDAKKSELNAAACHTASEVGLAKILDRHELVESWVRNFRLGFTVPWFDKDLKAWRKTEPDFIARTSKIDSRGRPVCLLIEFKGKYKERSSEASKKYYLEEWWAPSVSAWNDGEYGTWKIVWVEDNDRAAGLIEQACREAEWFGKKF